MITTVYSPARATMPEATGTAAALTAAMAAKAIAMIVVNCMLMIEVVAECFARRVFDLLVVLVERRCLN